VLKGLILKRRLLIMQSDIQQDSDIQLLKQVKQGNVEEVEQLLKAGADPNFRDEDNRTPLHFAAKRGDTAVVATLRIRRIDPNMRYDDSNIWHKELVPFFTRRADLDVWDCNNQTPLHFASEQGHVAVVSVFLNEGACQDIRDHNHQTPLHLAAKQGHVAVVSVFLAKGANLDLDFRDKDGKTPLCLAVEKGYVPIVTALLAKGANPNVCYKNGKTLLMQAYELGDTDILTLLRKAYEERRIPIPQEYASPQPTI
jgi:cytohesin